MFETRKENERAVQALVGKVEWAHAMGNNASQRLSLILRVDGELCGLSFREVEPGVVYGPRGKENRYPMLNETAIESLSREQLLEAVAWLELDLGLSLFTEAERNEWDAHCAAEDAKRAQREAEREAREQAARRREYERLKAEFGNPAMLRDSNFLEATDE